MPGIYSSVASFQNTPLGATLADFTSGLSASLDSILIEASSEADKFTKRKLQAPSKTNLKGAVSPAATSFAVDNCAGIYSQDVVVFQSGETLQVTGCDPDPSSGPPYAGTVYLNGQVAGSYADDGTVTFYRQCRYTVRGRAISDLDQAAGMSQAGQLAEGHAPTGGGGSARRLFVDEKPLWSVLTAYQTLPWTNSEQVATLTYAYLKESGSLELPIGYYNPIGSKWRLQYIAGFTAIPQDICDAVHLYMADKISRAANPMGAVALRNADQQATMVRNTGTPGEGPPAPLYIELAERILRQGGYCRKGPR